MALGLLDQFTRFFSRLRPSVLLITLGFVSSGISTSLAATVLIEIVAAFDVGSTFQTLLIAYQPVVDEADMTSATVLFAFIDSLSTSIAVVVGGILFQNGMAEQSQHLASVLGPEVAQNISAPSAAANVLMVQTLPMHKQEAARHAYVSTLKHTWAIYASFGDLVLTAAPCEVVKKQTGTFFGERYRASWLNATREF